jgi:hypothetical protein
MSKNLIKSLRPLVLLFHWIGIFLPIDLKCSVSLSLKRRTANWCYVVTCFVVNVASQIVSFLFFLQPIATSESRNYDTSITYYNAIFEYAHFTLTNVAIHFNLLTIVRPRWAALIESFQHIERFILRPKFFVRLHRFSLFVVYFIMFMVNQLII